MKGSRHTIKKKNECFAIAGFLTGIMNLEVSSFKFMSWTGQEGVFFSILESTLV